MKKTGIALLVILAACGQASPPEIHTNETVFIRLSDPTDNLTIVRNQNKGGVVYIDAYVESQYEVTEMAEYIFAQKFGIAISVPFDLKNSPKQWAYNECEFLELASLNSQNATYSYDFFSFRSYCKNSSTYNDYMLNSSGDILAFNIHEKNNLEKNSRTTTFLALGSNDKN